jgi:hypothetical protein
MIDRVNHHAWLLGDAQADALWPIMELPTGITDGLDDSGMMMWLENELRLHHRMSLDVLQDLDRDDFDWEALSPLWAVLRGTEFMHEFVEALGLELCLEPCLEP